jgi:F420H(2)-dependent quinone reductase
MKMRLSNWLVRLIDRLTRLIYSWTDGRVGHTQMGWTMLLLTTTGRRSGRHYTHTLAYLQDGSRLLVVASNNGSDRHPDWYLNLCVNPRVQAHYGRKKGDFMARTATPQERAALWPRLVAYHAPYIGHQAHTRRELPVVILEPITRTS